MECQTLLREMPNSVFSSDGSRGPEWSARRYYVKRRIPSAAPRTPRNSPVELRDSHPGELSGVFYMI